MYKTRFYRIQIAVPLTSSDAGWFEDLTIGSTPGLGSVLITPAIDQTALHGILATLRDLAIPLLTVEPLDQPPREVQVDFPTAPLPDL